MFIIFRNNSYEFVGIRNNSIGYCCFINHLKYEYFKYSMHWCGFYINYDFYINYEWFSKNNIEFYHSKLGDIEYHYDVQSFQIRDYNQLFINRINNWEYICL